MGWIRELCRIAIRKRCRRCPGEFGRESLFSALSDQIPLLILVKNLDNLLAPLPESLGQEVVIFVVNDCLRPARSLLTATENLSKNTNAGITLYTDRSSSIMRVYRRGMNRALIQLPVVHESPMNDILLGLGQAESSKAPILRSTQTLIKERRTSYVSSQFGGPG